MQVFVQISQIKSAAVLQRMNIPFTSLNFQACRSMMIFNLLTRVSEPYFLSFSFTSTDKPLGLANKPTLGWLWCALLGCPVYYNPYRWMKLWQLGFTWKTLKAIKSKGYCHLLASWLGDGDELALPSLLWVFHIHLGEGAWLYSELP